jgi:predicted ATPase
MMRINTGQRIGEYEVDGLIGRGGMAEVWGVHHAVSGTRHALKVLTAASPTQQRRLIREGNAQQGLSHANLLAVEAILEVDGAPALVMPLVEGPSLAELLKGEPLDLEICLALGRAVALGLAHAHERALVHRDLKPANILLQPEGGRVVPKVADFGLVKAEDTQLQTRSGDIFGTPAYASPEQLREARSVDQRADLWSLGVTLAEAIQGRRPFEGSSVGAIVLSHMNPPDLSGVPELVRPLLTALLRRRPEQRPGSAAEVAQALGALLGEGVDPLATDPDFLRLVETHRRSIREVRPSDVDDTWHSIDAGRPAELPEHNLPALSGAFVGRSRAVTDVRRALAGHWLVTLKGPAGIGKTRLAVEAAHQDLVRWPGGVCFCDLSGAREEGSMLAAIAGALGVPPGRNPRERLGAALAGRACGGRGRMLLVLDNLEQLGDGVAPVLEEWRSRCPELGVLATSRRPVRGEGEKVLEVRGLSLDSAAALFCERARAVGAQVSPEDAGPMVGMLDGLPLAIELAAARAGRLSPLQLAGRMSRRFAMLRSRDDSLPPRQRTLKGAITWSWELLEPDEQHALARFSVFEGGFTLEAAEAVLGDEDGELFVDDLLDELIDSSLLRSRLTDGSPRFSMLAAVKDFAAQQLQETPEERADALLRHAEHYAGYGSYGERPATTGEELADLRARRQEIDNLLAAARRVDEHGRGNLATRALLGAVPVLSSDGPFDVWRDTLRSLLTRDDLDDATRVEALLSLAVALRHAAPAEALDSVREAVTLSKQAGLRDKEARSLYLLGRTSQHTDAARGEGRAALEASLAIERRPRTLIELGIQDWTLGDRQRAVERVEEALELARNSGDPLSLDHGYYVLGFMRRNMGQLDAAIAALEAALESARALQQHRSIGLYLNQLSLALGRRGDLARAEAMAAECLRLARHIGDDELRVGVALSAATVATHQGRLSAAAAGLQEMLAGAGGRGMGLNCQAMSGLMEVRWQQGRWEEVRALGGALEAAAKAAGLGVFVCFTRICEARLAALGEDARAALEALEALQGQVQTYRNADLTDLWRFATAEVCLRLGDPEGARAALGPGLAAARLEGAWLSQEQHLALLARAAEVAGEDPLPLLGEAIHVAERCGAALDEALLRSHRARLSPPHAAADLARVQALLQVCDRTAALDRALSRTSGEPTLIAR